MLEDNASAKPAPMEGDGGCSRSSRYRLRDFPQRYQCSKRGEDGRTAGWIAADRNSRLRFLARSQLSASAGRGRCHSQGAHWGHPRDLGSPHRPAGERFFSTFPDIEHRSEQLLTTRSHGLPRVASISSFPFPLLLRSSFLSPLPSSMPRAGRLLQAGAEDWRSSSPIGT